MKIEKIEEGGRLTLAIEGRIDTITAPELESALTYDGVDELVFDLAKVDYISSAGLRVLLSAQKKMMGKSMKIANPCKPVMEVFDITGFSSIFTFI